MALIYSPDDQGWYWERRYTDWKVSQLFNSKPDALLAKMKGMLEWN